MTDLQTQAQGAALAPLAPNQLTEEQQRKVDGILRGIDVNDSQAVIQYGTEAQRNISDFSDSVLSQIKSKDAGYVGNILTDLMLGVKSLDVDSLTEQTGFFGKLFSNMKARMTKFMAKFESLSTQIEKIVDELDKAKMGLLKDITLMDGMYDKNLDYMRDLELFIIAGKQKLEEVNTVLIPQMKEAAQKSGDAVDAQKARDLTQLAERFEKKLYDLELSRTIAIQTAPQLRIIQNNDQMLVEKIQSSIMNTIPLWKNQIVIAISLYRQQEALEMQKKVTDTTNELLTKNSTMLKENSIGVAKENQRGIVELETLRKVHTDLITTLEETVRISEEGHANRMQAETELARMENELKAKLLQLRDRK